jgi:hypothetical protein
VSSYHFILAWRTEAREARSYHNAIRTCVPLLGSLVSHEVVAASCGCCCFVEDILSVVSGIEYVWEGRGFTPASMVSTQTAFWWRSARTLLGLELVVVEKGRGGTGEMKNIPSSQ